MCLCVFNIFDVWYFVDNYVVVLFLSVEWIEEDKINFNCVFVVLDIVLNQFWVDIFVKNISVCFMFIYSIFGFIDYY